MDSNSCLSALSISLPSQLLSETSTPRKPGLTPIVQDSFTQAEVALVSQAWSLGLIPSSWGCGLKHFLSM